MLQTEFLELLEVRGNTLKAIDVKSVEVVAPQDHTGKRKLRFNNEVVADGSFFDEIAHKLFNVPSGFLRKIPIDLSNTIARRMFTENQVSEKKQLIVKGDLVISTKSMETPTQPALPIFERAFKELPGDNKVDFHDYDTYFDVDIINDEIELKPKLNDITKGGVRCRYSEFMFKNPTVEPYTERLACLNGMTFPEFFNTYHFEDLPSFLADYGVAVKQAVDAVKDKIDAQLKKAVEMKVNGEQAIRRIFHQNRIPAKYLDAALSAHVVEGDGTMFGVLQAITRAANSAGNQRARLQSLGGRELAFVSASHCPECYAAL